MHTGEEEKRNAAFGASFAHFIENTAVPMTYVVAVLLGAGLGLLFSQMIPHLDGAAALALWPLGLALGALVVGLGTMAGGGETVWGLVFSGQALGAITLLLLLLAL